MNSHDLPPLGDPTLALATSLRAQSQRRELAALGRELGTPVVFLKAAWADPVLYGGRGERWGGDIDILVAPRAYHAFGEALCARGYVPRDVATHRATLAAAHERLYLPPGVDLPVDLHRELAPAPWFHLPSDALIARARPYPSRDGPILSLAPEDQIVFAAAHYASHALELDERHLVDCLRLLATTFVDWSLVAERGHAAHLTLALAWLGQELLRRGAQVPRAVRKLGVSERARLRAARHLARERPGKVTWRQVAVLSLLSVRPGAPVLFGARYLGLRITDRAAAG